MEIKILPSQQLIYQRRIGCYGSENNQLMTTFKEWLATQGLFNKKSIVLGIPWDNPASTVAKECRYDVALIVAEEIYLEQRSIQKGFLEGGKYAVFTVEHTAVGVSEMMEQWPNQLKESGYLLDGERPLIEWYDYQQIQAGFCQLYIPII